jgi:hypothetical protein
MPECPRNSWIRRCSTPASASTVPMQCRRSWNRMAGTFRGVLGLLRVGLLDVEPGLDAGARPRLSRKPVHDPPIRPLEERPRGDAEAIEDLLERRGHRELQLARLDRASQGIVQQVCDPPGPVTMSFRKPTPVARRRATLAAQVGSGSSRRGPAAGRRASGAWRNSSVRRALSASRHARRRRSAGSVLETSVKPRYVV